MCCLHPLLKAQWGGVLSFIFYYSIFFKPPPLQVLHHGQHPTTPQPLPLPGGSCSFQQQPSPMLQPLAPQCLRGCSTQDLGWFAVNRCPAPSPAWDEMGAALSWLHLPIPPTTTTRGWGGASLQKG